jgi:DNA-directed RNA polymerase specialized sigma24 family protein
VKRGGGVSWASLDAIGDVAALDADGEQVFAFDEAFVRLSAHEPRAADVVRLRFFAGLSLPEVARALEISERTVSNRWTYARAWLARAMREEAERGDQRQAH